MRTYGLESDKNEAQIAFFFFFSKSWDLILLKCVLLFISATSSSLCLTILFDWRLKEVLLCVCSHYEIFFFFILILLFSRSFCRFFTRHELHVMSVNSSFQLLFSLTTTHHHATRKHSHSRCIDDDTLFYWTLSSPKNEKWISIVCPRSIIWLWLVN